MVFFGPLRVRALAQAAIAADFNQTLDIQTDFTAQVAFYRVVMFNALTELCGFLFGQVFYAGIWVDTSFVKDII